jgi:hypothetical protein
MTFAATDVTFYPMRFPRLLPLSFTGRMKDKSKWEDEPK